MTPETVQPAPTKKAPRRRKGRIIGLVALVAVASFVYFGLAQRRENEAKLTSWTHERAIPYVKVVQPHVDTQPRILALPGSVNAFYDAAIHSQVSGYVKSWSKDIGALVKKGDRLAEIDTPELDERIAQAQEEVSKAKAALSLAQVTAQRWNALRNSAAVSKQSSDEKDSDAKVKLADVGAASANLDRLKAQKAFANIVAPFDGVVTARNIDIGSFVTANGGGQPLFRVADIQTARIYVNTPQVYAAQLKKGMSATFTVPQWPGRVFSAKIVATSNSIGAQTRSLLVELDTPNPDDALLPGSYADVSFELPMDKAPLRLASSALSFGQKGMQVATIDAENRVHFKKIEIATDFGAEVAIASGLDVQDRVVDDPSDTLADGDLVRIGVPAADQSAAK